MSDRVPRPRITVVGSLNMDLVVRAPRMPTPGETILGGPFETAPGGKGANQAVAAARLGAEVRMIGRVGDDAFGRELRAYMTDAGVDCSGIRPTAGYATGVGLIVVEEATGQNAIVVASGANMQLSPSDVEAAETMIAESDVLVLQFENPIETVTRAAEIARAHGVLVVLNPAPARALQDGLFSMVEVLVPNEIEAALLTNQPVGSPWEAEKAARMLLDRGPRAVIVTLGSKGALLAEEGTIELVPAFIVQPVDATAAGDAFTGGIAVALGEGRPLREAVEWGNAAGALATTVRGAMPSLPTREAVETLVRDQAAGGRAAALSVEC